MNVQMMYKPKLVNNTIKQIKTIKSPTTAPKTC